MEDYNIGGFNMASLDTFADWPIDLVQFKWKSHIFKWKLS